MAGRPKTVRAASRSAGTPTRQPVVIAEFAVGPPATSDPPGAVGHRTASKAKQVRHNPGNVGGCAPPDPGGVNPSLVDDPGSRPSQRFRRWFLPVPPSGPRRDGQGGVAPLLTSPSSAPLRRPPRGSLPTSVGARRGRRGFRPRHRLALPTMGPLAEPHFRSGRAPGSTWGGPNECSESRRPADRIWAEGSSIKRWIEAKAVRGQHHLGGPCLALNSAPERRSLGSAEGLRSGTSEP